MPAPTDALQIPCSEVIMSPPFLDIAILSSAIVLMPVAILRTRTCVTPPSQLNTAAVQLPIGLEDSHSGVVDVVCGRAFGFSGVKGENVEEIAMPEGMKVRTPCLRTCSRQRSAALLIDCDNMTLRNSNRP